MAAILDFRSEHLFAIFNLQIIPKLPIQFRVHWPFGSGKDFQGGRNLGFPIRTILQFFYPQVTPMLPTMFRVKWPSVSGEEAKNIFSSGHLEFPIEMI